MGCLLHYTGPQSFIIMCFFFIGLTTLGTILNFDWLGHLVMITLGTREKSEKGVVKKILDFVS